MLLVPISIIALKNKQMRRQTSSEKLVTPLQFFYYIL